MPNRCLIPLVLGLVACRSEAPDAANPPILAAIVAPTPTVQLSGASARGLDFAIAVPVGFVSAPSLPSMPDSVALREVDGPVEIFVARGPAISGELSDELCRATSGLRLEPTDRAEKFAGAGEGGCRYTGTVDGEALVETRVNHGLIAHSVICLAPDASRLQSICDAVVESLVIEPPTTIEVLGFETPVPPGWTVAPRTSDGASGRVGPLVAMIGPNAPRDPRPPQILLSAPSKATLERCLRVGGDCDRTPPELTCTRREDDLAAKRACEMVSASLAEYLNE